MNQLATTAIVLSRTNYGEADRILTVLTPDHGKLRLMARGVRRVKSKLAGGIELFSVSDITFIRGRGEIGTLVSTRLQKHYGEIVKDIGRTQLGYELIRVLHKITEDEPGAEYFELMEQAFDALNEPATSEQLIGLWFNAQLLRLGGHSPNLQADVRGKRLDSGEQYDFNLEDMAFAARRDGTFGPNDVKFLRLVFSGNGPRALGAVQGSGQLVGHVGPLVNLMTQAQLRTV